MKCLLLPILILVSVLANAQIQKGTVLLGGTIYADTYKSDADNAINSQKESSIGIAPSIGIATKENVVWGINAYYSTDKNKGDQQSEYTTYTNYGAGLFTRRYLAIAKAFYLFGEAGLGYSNNKLENPYYSMGTKESRTGWGVSINAYPGIAYSLTRRMQLELGLPNLLHAGYNETREVYTYNGFESKTTTTGFNISANLNPSTQLAVGFRILLGK